MRVLTILAAAIGLSGVSAAQNNEGRLSRVPLDLNPDGQTQSSWWLARTNEYSDQWKRKQLDFNNTAVMLFKLVDDAPLEDCPLTVTQPDAKGDFTIPNNLDGEYLLKVQHRAFRYPPVLITAEGGDKPYTYTVVESKRGVRHIVRRLPSLTLRPDTLQAPYPPPQPINIIAYLKNPMVIMILISLFVSFVMPRMINQEEMQAAAGEIPQLSTAFTNKVKEIKVN